MSRTAVRALVVAAALAIGGCVQPLDLGGERLDLVPFAGPRASCFLHRSGRLQCFGAGGSGELGRDPSALHSTCAGIPCQADQTTHPFESATDVAFGEAFACAVVAGTVSCVGANEHGTLGRGTTDTDVHSVPMTADLVGHVEEIVAGRHHVCARRDDGTVACWGLGNHGALGRDPSTLDACGTTDAADAERQALPASTPLRCATSPRDVPGIVDAVGLRAGPFATCVRRAVGPIVCFGRDVDGSLGVGPLATSPVTTPTPLAILDAIDVALGARHGCTLDALGRTFCSGRHDVGQLGLGSSAPDDCDGVPCARTPSRVTDLAAARAVHAGDEHTCVVLADDSLHCFGSDALGQVGDSATPSDDCNGIACARTPRPAQHLGAVAFVSVRGDHTVLVTRDGDPMVFGGNFHRECGANGADAVTWPSLVYGIAP